MLCCYKTWYTIIAWESFNSFDGLTKCRLSKTSLMVFCLTAFFCVVFCLYTMCVCVCVCVCQVLLSHAGGSTATRDQWTTSDTYQLITGNIYITTPGWPPTWKTWNTQGFLWTWKTQGILREFCATSGKNCNKQSILDRHSNICVQQLLTG